MAHTAQTKTKILQDQIMEHVGLLPLSSFLLSDCEKFVTTLNFYRTRALLTNMSEFSSYLLDLQHDFEQQEAELHTDDTGIDLTTTLFHTNEELQHVQAVRGFFLLTVVEFTQCTTERLLVKKHISSRRARKNESQHQEK